MTNTKIDVIVLLPVYNEIQTIAPLIENLCTQKEVNMKLICQDNHSDDGTWEILQLLSKDFDFDLSRTDHHVPIWENFNSTLKIARTKYSFKYFMWVGGDDFLTGDNFLKSMISKSNQYKDLIIIPKYVKIIGNKTKHLPFHLLQQKHRYVNFFLFSLFWNHVNLLHALIPSKTLYNQKFNQSFDHSKTSDWWVAFNYLYLTDGVVYDADSLFRKAVLPRRLSNSSYKTYIGSRVYWLLRHTFIGFFDLFYLFFEQKSKAVEYKTKIRFILVFGILTRAIALVIRNIFVFILSKIISLNKSLYRFDRV